MAQRVGGPLSLLTRASCCYQILGRRWTIGGGGVFHRGRGGTAHRATAQPSHHAFLKDALIVDPSVHLQRTIYGYVKINVDRARDRSSWWIGYWLDSRFRTVWSRLCRPLSSTRLSLLDGNPCNVSRWTRFLKKT